ncbi:hypothetical protein IFM89_025987 [Coptis chinensis]|uniref:R13L1/DRL21-like LRR repeat region domain-containing protein n=1 Tax=Coptis chinensis TaxID=261450 RepID=A0A835I5S3_9MAGN|nr:hypothetical protein IFM89_025987 [Coptis chinensis]
MKLRTLVGKSFKLAPSALLFHRLTCLRTLVLSPQGIYSMSVLEVLPSEVNRLLHLRYLDLSNTKLKELPETMRSLVNLQTLKLNGCYLLCKLPKGIGELSNLRYLEVKGTLSLKYYPRGGIERLSQLRTLSKFVVSDGSKGSVIGELGNLNFLKGRLDIRGLMHVKSVNEAKLAELQKKKNIQNLGLNFGDDQFFPSFSSEEEIRRMECVLENLEPHKESLERLFIRYYVGFMLPSWMLPVEESVLSNIVVLWIFQCPNLKVLPALGKLQFLEELSLMALSAMKHLSAELLKIGNGNSTSSSSSSSVVLFPKLKKLELSGLPEWEEEEHDVPTTSDSTTIIVMPRLHKLEICNCPKLKVEPHYLFPPLLETLKLEFNVNSCPALWNAAKTMKGEKALLTVKLQSSGVEGAVPPSATLLITLELVSWKTVTEVTNDKKVIKKIIKEGEGYERPNEGTVDNKGHDDDELFEFKMEEEQIIDGLDRAVMTTKERGGCRVDYMVSVHLNPSKNWLLFPRIQGVELESFVKERESWDMNTPDKIEAAGKEIEEQNVTFKAGKYAKASKRYEKAGKFIGYDTNFSEEENKQSKVLKVSCNLKNAACKLKL